MESTHVNEEADDDALADQPSSQEMAGRDKLNSESEDTDDIENRRSKVQEQSPTVVARAP